MAKTNKQIADDILTTPRQISKSRKRGWLYKFDHKWSDKLDLTKRHKYKAPPKNEPKL